MTPDRREFLRQAARVCTGGAIAAPLATLATLSCAPGERHPPRSFEATFDVSALVHDGQSVVPPTKGIDGYPILIVRTGADTFKALSMQCTHMGCPVNVPVGKTITCPCHGSKYDLAGKVLNGPAQFPLAEYGTEYDGKTQRLVAYVE